MKSMFIVSVDNGAHEVTAEGLREALRQKWGGAAGVKFSVEEGDHRKIAGFVSDYLSAEDALSEYEAAHGAGFGKIKLDSPAGRGWKSLYDDVQAKKRLLVGKLREYGCVA